MNRIRHFVMVGLFGFCCNSYAQEKIQVGLLMASHGDVDRLEEIEDYAKVAVRKNSALRVPGFLRPIIGEFGWPLVKNDLFRQYRSFGEATNYRKNSRLQAEAVTAALRSKGLKAKAYYGFNFTTPFIKDTLQEMREDGVENIVVINKGAQYSYATTEENFEDVMDGIRYERQWKPRVIGIRQFSEDPRFRQLMNKALRHDLATHFGDRPKSEVCVFLGSHGLPESLVQAGDPATQQMLAVVDEIRDELNDYQVYHGFLNDDFFPGATWTSPSAADMAPIVGENCNYVLLDGRLSFTTHHRATLYDMNVEARLTMQEMNPNIDVVFADNWDQDPDFAKLMADLTIEALNGLADTKELQ